MSGRAGRLGTTVAAWIATAVCAGYLMGPWFAPVPAPLSGESGGAHAAEPARGPGLVPQPTDDTGASPPLDAAWAAAQAAAGAPDRPVAPPSPFGAGTISAADPASAPPVAPAGMPPASGLGPLATGTLVVRVTGPGGEPGDGTAYVLPAGAPGSDDDDEILSADIEDRAATLEVPAGVRLDVGVASDAGTSLRTDVIVEPGAEVTVTVALPGAAPVTAELRDAPRELLDAPMQISVLLAGLDPNGATKRAYPGRTDRAWVWGSSFTLDRHGRGESGPLTPGARYAVSAAVAVAGGGTPTSSGAWRLVTEPAEASPGDHVVLRVAPSARLRIAVDAAGRSSRPNPYVQVQLWAGEQQFTSFYAFYEQLTGEPPAPPALVVPPGTDPAQAEFMRRTAELQYAQRQLALRRQWTPLPFECVVPPGPVRLAWTGDGVDPGTMDLGALAAGTITDVTVRAQFTDTPQAAPVAVARPDADAGEPEPSAEVPVELHGLPALAPDADPFPVAWFLAREGEPGEDPDVLDDEIYPSEPALWLGADDRRRALLGVAHAGPWLATDPVPVRDRAALRLEFRPAGLLLVLPGRLALPETPAVVLSRPDGAPIPYSSAGDLSIEDDGRVSPRWAPGQASMRVRAQLGRVLGPLPAGPVRLQVRRGGFLLGEVTATVVAGQIRPVVLAP